MDNFRYQELVYNVLVVACLGQRLLELMYSKYNQKRLKAHGFRLAETKKAFAPMFLVHVVWFLGLILEPYFLPRSVPGSLAIVGMSIFLLAQLLRFWVLKSLSIHWNVGVMHPDEGAESPSQGSFIQHGPYRWIRHPNYLAVCLEIFFLPLAGGAWVTTCVCSLLNIIILKQRIRLEESLLVTRPGYQSYQETTPAFIPSFRFGR